MTHEMQEWKKHQACPADDLVVVGRAASVMAAVASLYRSRWWPAGPGGSEKAAVVVLESFSFFYATHLNDVRVAGNEGDGMHGSNPIPQRHLILRCGVADPSDSGEYNCYKIVRTQRRQTARFVYGRGAASR